MIDHNKVDFKLESFKRENKIYFISGWVFCRTNKLKNIVISIGNKIIHSSELYQTRNDIKDVFDLKDDAFSFEIYFQSNSNVFNIKFTFKDKSLSKVIPINFSEGNKFSKLRRVYLEAIKNLRFINELSSIGYQHLKRNNYSLTYNFSQYVELIKSQYSSSTHSIIISKPSGFFNEQKIKSDEIINLSDNLKDKINSHIYNFKINPKISIIVPVYNVKKQFFIELLNSLKTQLYKNFELIIVDNGSNEDLVAFLKSCKFKFLKLFLLKRNYGISYATNFGIAKASGEYIAFLDHDDALVPDTLYLIADCINQNRSAKWIYTDEAKIDEKNRIYGYQFKPDYSPSLLLCTNYIQHFNVVKKSIAIKVKLNSDLDGAQDFDFCLRLQKFIKASEIFHIDKVAYLWRAHKNSTALINTQKDYITEKAEKSLRNYLNSKKLYPDIYQNQIAKKNNQLIFNVKWKKENDEFITIIIPNRNAPNLIKKCLKSIQATVDCKKIKIIIIDDNSSNPQTFKIYSAFNKNIFNSFEVINFKRKVEEFNYSNLINRASSYVKTKYFIQLNNDIQAIHAGWIEQMQGWFNIPGVKIVGANLYYPNSKIQHSGVHIGPNGGLADHIFREKKDFEKNYFGLLNCSRNVSAVTGACMMVETKFYKELNGFDAKKFKVQFNDVDFCLRARNKGSYIVQDPLVKLSHLESASRKNYDYYEHVNFIEKYPGYVDCYYNNNFINDKNDFSINLQRNFYHNKFKQSILIIVHELSLTGAPIVALNQAKFFIKKGYEVTIYSPKDGPLKKLIVESKINLLVYKNQTQFKSYEVIEELKKIIHVKKINVVVANSLHSIWHLLDFISKPIVKILNVHESQNLNSYISKQLVGQDISNSYKKNLESLRSFNSIIFQAVNTAKIFDPLDLLRNKKHIPGSLPYNEIKKYKSKNKINFLRKKYFFSSNDILISNIGTICPRKGQKNFIHAALKLLKQEESRFINCKFVLVGDIDTSYSSHIKTLIPTKYLKYFYFVKETSSIYDFYEISDIFVCTSYEESFPMVLLLAMAFELPIITTNVNGIVEMLSENSSILLPPDDIDGLSNAIKKLVFNKSYCFELSSYAKSKFVRYYDESICLSNYQDHIEKLIYY